MANHLNWKGRAVVLLCMVVVAVMSWRCTNQSPKPSEPAKPFLVIEDDHAAVWMNFDNAFADPALEAQPEPPADAQEEHWVLRNGVLLQLRFFLHRECCIEQKDPGNNSFENVWNNSKHEVCHSFSADIEVESYQQS